MSAALLAFQQAVYTALQDDATLSALISGVYDSVPEGTALPYISMERRSSEVIRTVSAQHHAVQLRLQIWSGEIGLREALLIHTRMETLLHTSDLNVTDYHVHIVTAAVDRAERQNRGLSSRLRMTLRAVLEQQ